MKHRLTISMILSRTRRWFAMNAIVVFRTTCAKQWIGAITMEDATRASVNVMDINIKEQIAAESPCLQVTIQDLLREMAPIGITLILKNMVMTGSLIFGRACRMICTLVRIKELPLILIHSITTPNSWTWLHTEISVSYLATSSTTMHLSLLLKCMVGTQLTINLFIMISVSR